MSFHLIREDLLLGLIAMLKQLLNDVVAKHIGHQLEAVGLYLAEHLLLFVAVGRFQFLLDETRSMLITAKLDHMVVNVLLASVTRSCGRTVTTNLQLISLVAFAVGPELLQQRATDHLVGILVAVGPRDH